MRGAWWRSTTETTSLDEMRAELVGVSLAVEPGHACPPYIPVGHSSGGGEDLFAEGGGAGGRGRSGWRDLLATLKRFW